MFCVNKCKVKGLSCITVLVPPYILYVGSRNLKFHSIGKVTIFFEKEKQFYVHFEMADCISCTYLSSQIKWKFSCFQLPCRSKTSPELVIPTANIVKYKRVHRPNPSIFVNLLNLYVFILLAWSYKVTIQCHTWCCCTILGMNCVLLLHLESTPHGKYWFTYHFKAKADFQ